jgi:hypothetical protein
MASYLKKYVDRVHDVPPQLQRLFKLIRDLDERVASLQAAVEDKCRQSLASAAPTKKQRAKAEAALRDEVNADMQKMLSLAEEKVGGARGAGAARGSARILAQGRRAGCWPNGHVLQSGGASSPLPRPPRAHTHAAPMHMRPSARTHAPNRKTHARPHAHLQLHPHPRPPTPNRNATHAQIRIAAQVYDFVDGHIRQLDEDLRAFDGGLHSDRARLGLKVRAAAARGERGGGRALDFGGPPTWPRAEAGAVAKPLQQPDNAHPAARPGAPRQDGETASKALGIESDYPANAPGAVRQKRKYNSRKKGADGGSASSPIAAAGVGAPTTLAAATALADSSEPRYCVCNNVSYGEMVACDNPDCIVEWFHYECVGITQQPKGKWYCPQCRASGFG